MSTDFKWRDFRGIAGSNNFDYILLMAYSYDFRGKVLDVLEREGLTIQQVSARFSVGVASVTRWIGNRERKPYHRTRYRKLNPAVIVKDVRDHPDDYQYNETI